MCKPLDRDLGMLGNTHENEMTRQKIKKPVFEAPKVGGLARNSLITRANSNATGPNGNIIAIVVSLSKGLLFPLIRNYHFLEPRA